MASNKCDTCSYKKTYEFVKLEVYSLREANTKLQADIDKLRRENLGLRQTIKNLQEKDYKYQPQFYGKY